MSKITTSFGEFSILPYCAMIGMRENISFLTDVMEAFNSTEERIKLRVLPRQTLSYSYPMGRNRMAHAFNVEYGAIRKQWAIPMWAEWQLVGEVLADAVSITCDTVQFDLRSDSLALLYTSDTIWQVVEIGSITPTEIEVTNSLIHQVGGRLIPLRIGRIEGDILKAINNIFSLDQINYYVDQAQDIEPETPEQYLGEDIYFNCPLLQGDAIQRAISQRNDLVDFDLGLIDSFAPWVNSRYSWPLRTVLMNPFNIREYRDFIYRRAGRYRRFWMPSFEKNIRLVSTGYITTTILIKNDGFMDDIVRNNIAIKKTDGTWSTNVVSSPTIIGENIQLTLSTSLGYDASLIDRISYLGLYRLDSDNIELNWIKSRTIESNVNIVELTP